MQLYNHDGCRGVTAGAGEAADGLDALRAAILADDGLRAELGAITDHALFAARLFETAQALGLSIVEPAIRQATQPDALGLSRFTHASTPQRHWPQPGFLPIHITPHGIVDWAWFGARRLSEPFFEDSIRKALYAPFGRLFRAGMTLDDFIADAPRHETSALMPSGFIFHMSRCGSTLAAQMLASSARNIVVSEAAPIDAAVQSGRADLLRAMVLAFGRPRSGQERRYVIKLDSWHTLSLPLFKSTFPDVPWVFLYRDPLEVMVSQMREPGSQMVPQFLAPSFYGIDNDIIPGPDYTARALNSICTAAADALPSPRGLSINYRDLPDAVEQRILPHFGITPDDGERAAMREACRFNAKSTTVEFAPDSAAKRAAASDALRATTERHLGDIFRRLEGLSVT